MFHLPLGSGGGKGGLLNEKKKKIKENIQLNHQ